MIFWGPFQHTVILWYCWVSCCSTFSVPLRRNNCEFWLLLNVHLSVNSPFKVVDLQVSAMVLVFFIAYCDLTVLALCNKPFILHCDSRKNFPLHLFLDHIFPCSLYCMWKCGLEMNVLLPLHLLPCEEVSLIFTA